MKGFVILEVILISEHLDVSVGDVDGVEKVNGRADVPHNLRCLWEEKRKTQSQTRRKYYTTGVLNRTEIGNKLF